jgi:hypothetical protein
MLVLLYRRDLSVNTWDDHGAIAGQHRHPRRITMTRQPCGFGGATPHQVLLARIARQGRGSFERGTRFLEAAKFMQQITPLAGEQVIALERWLAQKAVHNRQRDIRSLGHADGHRAVEFDDRRTHQTGQFGVEPDDARPVVSSGVLAVA